MDVVIGIDGGGSKTLALVAGLSGPVLGRGSAGASNYQGVGLPAAQGALGEAIARALADAGVTGGKVAAICIGLAGAGRAEDQAAFGRWVSARLPGARCRIANDAELVLAAGSVEGWGLAVIAGTGSIAYGRNRRGAVARAGGWGPLLGDEGSGYAIGRAALRAAVAGHDGRAATTSLLDAILGHWSLRDAAELVEKAYRPPLVPAEIASLAVLVEAAADQGDAAALRILEQAGSHLAITAAAVARGLGLAGETPCATAGSVLVKGRRLREAFAAGLVRSGIAPAPLVTVEEPAAGALQLARDLLATRAE